MSHSKSLWALTADGLRADTLLDHDAVRAPHLSKIIQERGAWGVSHAHVPTETRTGHVALIGGIYEDPANVGAGWSENTVPFDSVFNQSTNTYCWGSPDVLPMFARGVEHVHAETYPPTVEDFGAEDASSLDQWVLVRVRKFFNKVIGTTVQT